MTKTKEITVCFMTEKKVGHGEDAQPILIVKDNSYAVGVFDGMGGAGAATCLSDYGEGYTKAYVASRITRDVLDNFLKGNIENDQITAEMLKTIISERLRQEVENYPAKEKSMLRTKLVRDYPTTMALIIMKETDKGLEVNSFWAGDSHCYLWTKSGFYQISKDDLEGDTDPMNNLHNDSPISNCICADKDFYINHRAIPVDKEPIVILCATDGCFGYYSTPMHFEYIIKECLRDALDAKDWQDKINSQIQIVTGDDTSLSLVALGFDCFDDLKRTFTVTIKSIDNIIKCQNNIKEAQELLEQYRKEYDDVVDKGWEEYKEEYMKYIKR